MHGMREVSAGKDKSLARSVVLLIPLALAGVESFYRADVIATVNKLVGAGAEDPVSWVSVLMYWATYILLIGSFVVLFLWIFPRNPARGKDIEHSAFRQYRNDRDPLLGLRSLAFLMVFLGHWFMVVFPPADLIDLVRQGSIVWILTASPWGGVWIFFTLSAYLMGKGFFSERYHANAESVRRFYRNRALRILPIYLSAVVITGVLRTPEVFEVSDPEIAFNTISVFLFDQRDVMPIFALWSISTEVQFYAVVPFLCIILNTVVARELCAIPLIGLIAISSFLLKHWAFNNHLDWHSYVYFPLLANMDAFSIGLLTALVTARSRHRNLVIRHGFSLGVVTTILSYFGLSYWSAHGMLCGTDIERTWFLSIAPAVTSLLAAIIIMFFELGDYTSRSAGISSRLAWKAVTHLGLWTYALYVWHEPILLSLRETAPRALTFVQSSQYLLVGVPLLLSVGWFFFRMVELPFDRLRDGGSSVTWFGRALP